MKTRTGVGNMNITVTVEVPTRLSRDQRRELEAFDGQLDIKQSGKMNAFRNNVQAMYGVDPYKN